MPHTLLIQEFLVKLELPQMTPERESPSLERIFFNAFRAGVHMTTSPRRLLNFMAKIFSFGTTVQSNLVLAG